VGYDQAGWGLRCKPLRAQTDSRSEPMAVGALGTTALGTTALGTTALGTTALGTTLAPMAGRHGERAVGNGPPRRADVTAASVLTRVHTP
jgi:hypothetical protein